MPHRGQKDKPVKYMNSHDQCLVIVVSDRLQFYYKLNGVLPLIWCQDFAEVTTLIFRRQIVPECIWLFQLSHGCVVLLNIFFCFWWWVICLCWKPTLILDMKVVKINLAFYAMTLPSFHHHRRKVTRTGFFHFRVTFFDCQGRQNIKSQALRWRLLIGLQCWKGSTLVCWSGSLARRSSRRCHKWNYVTIFLWCLYHHFFNVPYLSVSWITTSWRRLYYNLTFII